MTSPNINKNINNISYSLLYGGLIIVLLTLGTLNKSAVSGAIAGYSASWIAILFLFSLTYTNYSSSSIKNNSFSWKTLGLIFIPYLILLGIIGYSLTLIGVYFDNISSDRVSPYYVTFSYISTIFIIIQVYIFGNITSTNAFTKDGTINSLSLVKLILLGVINILVLISLGISLKYFSTDG
jgi:hypothetical protein